MKKVTLVCLAQDREQAVGRLQDLGTVHVVPVRPPMSGRLDQVVRQREDTTRALALLEKRQPHGTPLAAPDEAVSLILTASAELTELAERRSKLQRASALLAPWGSMRQDSIDQLREGGFQLLLTAIGADETLSVPDGVVCHEISRSGKTVYMAVIAPVGVTVELPEISLPEIGDRAAIEAGLQECGSEEIRLERTLDALAVNAPGMEAYALQLEADLTYIATLEGMGSAETLAYLTGYVPVGDADTLLAACRENGWAARLEDPAEDDMGVPTKLVLPAWVRPIRLIFQGLGILPGYREIDISACFLLFFSLFFAILIGDAGYGFVFLLLTLAARAKFRDAPAQPFWLFGSLSATTIVWGILTGTYFAISLPDGHLLKAIPSVSYLGNPQNVQRLCFLIGAIHLTIAHGWNAMVMGRTLKALGQLAWIPMLWGNYFMALVMVLGQPKHPAMPWLYGAGFLGVLLFTAPQKNPLRMLGTGVGELLLNVVNSFVDIVSYVRLFAAGAATVKVAESFNNLASGFDSMPPIVAGLIGATILLLGHSFNMLLGAMAVMVHGVRLNVLEFAGHIGLEFTGVTYAPLKTHDAKTAE